MIRTDRLRQLADFLLQPGPSTHFNYNRWVGEDWKGLPDLSCGTSACALGWGTVLFPHLLRLVKDTSNPQIMGYVEYVGDNPAPEVGDHLAPASFITSLHAAMSAFGLTREQAEYLFSPETNPDRSMTGWEELSDISPDEDATSEEVSEHIRNFCDWAEAHGL